ncbi:elongation factor Tu [Nocardiopsis alba]|uniref:elongation factor Tu n=1 Tax=Nocardiopsis alba TaxID=53437 RepID=UPI0033D81306
MAKASERTGPQINICTIGHVDHGKTTLTAALTKVLHEADPDLNGFTSFDALDKAPEERQRGVEISIQHVDYRTESRHYAHSDCPGHLDYISRMVEGVGSMDGAILVVSGTEGPTAQTREHVRLARHSRIPYIVPALTKVDLAEDEENLELIELEVRELLSEYEFDGDNAPVVKVSALKALEGDTEAGETLRHLVAAMDENIPDPERDTTGPLLMPIEEVFPLKSGATARGTIERGVVKVGDAVDIIGVRSEKASTTVTGITSWHNEIDEARAGETVSLLLKGVGAADMDPGQVIVRAGSEVARTGFEASVYILSSDEGGLREPLQNGHGPRFRLRTAEVAGTVTLEEGTEEVRPGDEAEVSVRLADPVVLEEDLRFTVHEEGRVIGEGRITKVDG